MRLVPSLNLVLSAAVRRFFRFYLNGKNRIRFGSDAPKCGELVWVVPDEEMMFLTDNKPGAVFGVPKWKGTGRVINSDWPVEDACRIIELPKIRMCVEHWKNGVSWENTGIYERFMSEIRESGQYRRYGFSGIEEVKARYQNLDKVFEQARQDGRLRREDEITIDGFRGKAGYGSVHVGPSGTLYWSGGAQHRLGIAYILQVPMPARLGVVHVRGISRLRDLRRQELDFRRIQAGMGGEIDLARERRVDPNIAKI